VSHNLLNDFSAGGDAIDVSSTAYGSGKFGVFCTASSGNIAITTYEGDELTVPAIQGVLPWAIRSVKSAANGTTVTNGNLFSVRL
jgi:hypothetical protein